MSQITPNEYIYELTKTIGDAYNILYNNLNDVNNPETPIFEIEQIQMLAKNNAPNFGIIKENYDTFIVSNNTFPTLLHTVKVTKGVVGYKGKVYNVPEQNVSYARVFGSQYPNDYIYGVFLGIPIQELQKAQSVYTTTIKNDFNPYIDYLEIPNEDIIMIKQLGFPLLGKIGNYFITFNRIIDNKLYYEKIIFPYNINDTITIIYEPKIKTICGLPVAPEFYNNTIEPNNFQYYPIFPSDWLPIAKFLVINPSNPTLTGDIIYLKKEWDRNNSLFAIYQTNDKRKYNDYNYIYNVTDATKNLLSQLSTDINESFNDIVLGLNNYIIDIENNTDIDFIEYWRNRPFELNNIFIQGLSYNELTKFEFAESFARAYYNVYKINIPQTFAIFRGDMYEKNIFSQSIYNPLIQPPKFIIKELTDITTSYYNSILQTGLYVYGISVTFQDTNNNNFETYPEYNYIKTTQLIPYIEIIATSGISVSSNITYNIYRKTNLIGEQIEYKIASGLKTFIPNTSTNPTGTSWGVKLDQNSYIISDFIADSNFLFGVIIPIKLNIGNYSQIHLNKNCTITAAIGKYDDINPNTTPIQIIKYSLPISILNINNEKYSNVLFVFSIDANTRKTDLVELELNKKYCIIIGQNSNISNINYSSTAIAICPKEGSGYEDKILIPKKVLNNKGIEYLNIDWWRNGNNSPFNTYPVFKFKLGASNIPEFTNLEQEYIIYDIKETIYNSTEYWVIIGQKYPSGEDIVYTPNPEQDVYVNFYFDPFISIKHSNETISGNSKLHITNSLLQTPDNYLQDNNISPLMQNNETYLQFTGFIDNGIIGDILNHRGVKLTGKKSIVPTQLRVYVPPIDIPYFVEEPAENETISEINSINTRNEMIVNITAYNSITYTIKDFTIKVPANTPRKTAFPVGNKNDKFDEVLDVKVKPGAILRTSGNRILWSKYDLITVENI